jgi:hypothetical protein
MGERDEVESQTDGGEEADQGQAQAHAEIVPGRDAAAGRATGETRRRDNLAHP